MRYSIIIPAYNVQDYIVDCVISVFKQSFKDYEVILVNDGSTDHTGNLCQELLERNKEVKLINKLNGGLSSARNAGIDIAKGDYLLFLDGDDFWRDIDFLEKLNNFIEIKSPDIIIFPYSYYYTNDKIRECKFNLTVLSEVGDFNSDLYSMIDNGIWFPSACNKCIRREIIAQNNIFFPLNLTSEDVRWCFEISKYINSYCIYNEAVYMYRQNREGSISYKLKENNLKDLFKNINFILSREEKTRLADYLYLSHYYLEVIPYVSLYLRDEYVSSMLVKYKWLSEYSKNTKNIKKKLIYYCLKYMGFRLSSIFLNALVKLYRLK